MIVYFESLCVICAAKNTKALSENTKFGSDYSQNFKLFWPYDLCKCSNVWSHKTGQCRHKESVRIPITVANPPLWFNRMIVICMFATCASIDINFQYFRRYFFSPLFLFLSCMELNSKRASISIQEYNQNYFFYDACIFCICHNAEHIRTIFCIEIAPNKLKFLGA